MTRTRHARVSCMTPNWLNSYSQRCNHLNNKVRLSVSGLLHRGHFYSSWSEKTKFNKENIYYSTKFYHQGKYVRTKIRNTIGASSSQESLLCEVNSHDISWNYDLLSKPLAILYILIIYNYYVHQTTQFGNALHLVSLGTIIAWTIAWKRYLQFASGGE